MTTAPLERSTVEALLDAAPMTRIHWRVWLLAAMGLMLDGFDFFVMGVAIPLIREDLSPSAMEIGLISAAAVVGAMVGAATIGRATDRLGRSRVFKIDLAAFVVFALASAAAPNIWTLILFRFLLGVGVGADYPISAAYVSEIIPARNRSRMLVGAFSLQAVGQLLGVVVGLIVLRIVPDAGAWRWMLAAGVLPALAIVVLRRGVPESPKWLACTGQIEEACAVTSLFVGRVVHEAEVEEYAEEEEPDVPWQTLFRPAHRRRTILSSAPWFLMDVSTYGIGVFTPAIIAAIGIGASDGTFIAQDIASTEGAAVVDVFLVVGFALAVLLITRVGHIRLQVGGFLAMAIGLGVLGIASTLAGGGDDHLVLVLVGFAVFNLFMNMGPNSTTFVLPAEIFPTELRATGHGFAASSGKLGAAVGLVAFPLLQDALGLGATLAVLAVLCVLAAGITFRFRSAPSAVG